MSGNLRGLLFSGFFALTGIASTAANEALAQDASTSCAPAIGRLISLQGGVEVQRAGTTGWLKVSRLDTMICAGDRLRTDALSRAALFVQPETLVRVDQNTTISLSQTTAEVLVEFHTGEVRQAAQNAQSCGAGYFITRFPRKFKVSTPHMNAAVEGTEFMVESSCKASTLTVFEGQVLSQSAASQETRSLTASQRLETGPAEGSVFSTVVKPADAVQWVLRYPPLSEAARQPGIPTEERCQALPETTRPSCLTERAEMLLRFGLVDEALQGIDQALALDAANSDANALRAIVQVAKNDKTAALESAGKAIAVDASNYRAWLAHSYAQQASFELEQALESAERAQVLQARSSLVNARVAELLLTLGDAGEAERFARMAIEGNPGESHGYSVLGFVHLAQFRLKEAGSDFQAAIERDSFASLPRLGLALVLIRDGKLVAGREQLEIAVVLDPGNSIVRSYVGKAYYAENTNDRDALAAIQFGLAANLDPVDPTPHLYEAIRLQSSNRPVESLQEIRRSVELNDNRAVYRSEFKLDQDLAARSASQGRIYRDLGFEDLAVLEGWKSVNSDPGDFSGHRLLADVYSARPRHELARVNELFVSQMLQPLNLTPVPPQLGETNLFILDTAGPSEIAFNEFNPLFTTDGHAVQVSAIVGGDDTWGNDFAVSAIEGSWSFSLGQFHFETDGFRPNNDLDQDSYNAFVQYRHSERTSFLAEARLARREAGDLRLLFDPNNFNPALRSQEDSESLRIGVRHTLTPRAEVLASLVYQNAEIEDADPPIAEVASDFDGYTAELQHIFDAGRWRLVSGLRQSSREQTERRVLFGEETIRDFDFDSTSVYAYSHISLADTVNLIAGASGDFLQGRAVDEDRLNPKLGLTWEPSEETKVRLAAIRTIQPVSYSRQDIPPRLEPTQVAGFNQVFAGAEGESEWRYGIGADHEISPVLFVGAELSMRDIEIPVIALGPPDTLLEFDAEEYAGHAYLHWIPNSRIAASIAYRYDKRENDEGAALQFGTVELRTHRAPLSIRYFHASGFSFEASATYVDQQGDFLEFLPVPPFFQSFSDGDRFWVMGAALRYRLPRRAGLFALGVENLLDEEFRFQDVDPENPDIIPHRLVSLKLTVAF